MFLLKTDYKSFHSIDRGGKKNTICKNNLSPETVNITLQTFQSHKHYAQRPGTVLANFRTS